MKSAGHRFGGNWTEEKLARVREYLTRYRVALRKQPFITWYVDAFAGTGARAERNKAQEQSGSGVLFEDVDDDAESNSYRKGSATIALELDDPFHRYLFIDQRKRHVDELEASVRQKHPELVQRCFFRHGNANEVLKKWCASRNWKSERAVVFLDPYGMQVEWNTIAALAETHGVDLWYLFPLGMGVLRMLTRDGEMEESWCNRLDSLFGTPDWRTRFYETRVEKDLFGEVEVKKRDASAEKLQTFIEERLANCFPAVADGLILRNSRSYPMYSLCFAASNEKGASIALRIAQSILKKESRKRK